MIGDVLDDGTTAAAPASERAPADLLDVRDLRVVFTTGHGVAPVRAVDGVSFTVREHETVGLVGESGSGKTTIGRAILGLAPIASGSIHFAGRDLASLGRRARQQLSMELQVVFQDPYNSLNPTRTIGQTLAESLHNRRDLSSSEIATKVRDILQRVGLPSEVTKRYPAHFSGGQRQRIAIARALVVQPRLVICDEPVSALDLSVQAQVLNLLRELQDDLQVSYLFVAHDLTVVRHLSQRTIVLYRGRIMEQGSAASVYDHPRHPYTKALLAAAPIPDPATQRARRAGLHPRDEPGRSADDSIGCPYAPRCADAIPHCRSVAPSLEATDVGSLVACHRWRELIGRSS